MNETIPFVQGSVTSEDAAHAKRPTASSDEGRVLKLIVMSGVSGATDDEIEYALSMRHQNASARRNALVRKGLVKDSGMTRVTRSGRKATVWIVGQGEPLVGVPNDRVKRPNKEQLVQAADFLIRAGAVKMDDVAHWLRWLARH